MRVKATREGLVGSITSSGFVIDKKMPFVALPSVSALYKFVKLTGPAGKSCIAIVLDVGPWNTHDDDYVFNGARPLSEKGVKVDKLGNQINGPTNGAGIDLGEAVWNDLGLKDNNNVDWEFLLI